MDAHVSGRLSETGADLAPFRLSKAIPPTPLPFRHHVSMCGSSSEHQNQISLLSNTALPQSIHSLRSPGCLLPMKTKK